LRHFGVHKANIARSNTLKLYPKQTSEIWRKGLGRKRICGVFRAQGTCPLAANVVFLANSASPNRLAGFVGLLHGGGKRKENEGKEGKEKE